MATITLNGAEFRTQRNLPTIEEKASDFALTALDLQTQTLQQYKGENVVLNIFPSIDTQACAVSVTRFNELVSQIDNTVVLCISKDLPFAQKRFCGVEGLSKVVMLSEYKNSDFSDNS